MTGIVETGFIHDAELAELQRLRDELLAALDANADLRDKLDAALVAAESERAARGRAVNTTQLITSLLERAVELLVRHGQGDAARALSEGMKLALERP
jgi:hypothetical protein